MARLLLSKSTLAAERKKLVAYQRYLPSLDLKRQQLRQAEKQCQLQCQSLQQQLQQIDQQVREQLPMLANTNVDSQALMSVQGIHRVNKNKLGVVLPELVSVDIQQNEISPLFNPVWLGYLQTLTAQAVNLRLQLASKNQQLSLLQAAVVKITQRVNLFDNVLIPDARANIKRIQIFLSDREREAVVASKIAKRRHQQPGAQG